MHITNKNAPSGYKALGILMTVPNAYTPVLYHDFSGTTFVVTPNWGAATSTLQTITPTFLSNSDNIQAVKYGWVDSTTARFKIFYKTGIPAGSVLSLDDTVMFTEQVFYAS